MSRTSWTCAHRSGVSVWMETSSALYSVSWIIEWQTHFCQGGLITGFSSSYQWRFTSVWTAAHHRICLTTASRSPVLTRAGICVPPTVTYLPYRVSGSTLTAVGRSQLLARWPGTHSRILSGIQRAAHTVLGVYLKRTCSRVSSASSALAVLNDYALYKSTHSLTHSFTHSRVRIFLWVHHTLLSSPTGNESAPKIIINDTIYF